MAKAPEERNRSTREHRGSALGHPYAGRPCVGSAEHREAVYSATAEGSCAPALHPARRGNEDRCRRRHDPMTGAQRPASGCEDLAPPVPAVWTLHIDLNSRGSEVADEIPNCFNYQSLQAALGFCRAFCLKNICVPPVASRNRLARGGAVTLDVTRGVHSLIARLSRS